ncbi:MAG: YbaB/EbfC family nucleoid-associated protein [Nitrospinae bacterium]|nr:YbaB/EbfC family nucleoid-associated protein [Nitrospinota bacterium]
MSRMLADIFKKVQKIKSGISGARERLSAVRVEATSADGMVRVVASGDKQIVSIEAKPGLFSADPKGAQKLITQTCNEALKKAEAVLKDEFNKALGESGISLPGLF